MCLATIRRVITLYVVCSQVRASTSAGVGGDVSGTVDLPKGACELVIVVYLLAWCHANLSFHLLQFRQLNTPIGVVPPTIKNIIIKLCTLTIYTCTMGGVGVTESFKNRPGLGSGVTESFKNRPTMGGGGVGSLNPSRTDLLWGSGGSLNPSGTDLLIINSHQYWGRSRRACLRLLCTILHMKSMKYNFP